MIVREPMISDNNWKIYFNGKLCKNVRLMEIATHYSQPESHFYGGKTFLLDRNMVSYELTFTLYLNFYNPYRIQGIKEITIFKGKEGVMYEGKITSTFVKNCNGYYEIIFGFSSLSVSTKGLCPFCNKRGMNLMDLETEELIYNVCELCGEYWYIWK